MTSSLHFLLAGCLSVVVSAPPADLFDALNQNDEARVAKLLKDDPSLANKPDANGNLPLQYALRGKHGKIIPLLLDAGADVKAIDGNGFSVMHFAASTANKPVIELLLAKGAKVDVAAKFGGRTPLHFAASAGNKSNLALLLEKGASLEGVLEPNGNGPSWTPLYDAVTQGHLAAAEFLLAKGANPNAKVGLSGSPVDKAAEQRDLDMLRLLLAHGGNVNSESAFLHALQTCDRELVELFLNRGIDVKNPRYLITAAGLSKEITELLLDRGANAHVTEPGYSLLMSAAGRHQADVVALLLARGASVKHVDAENQTALHYASNATVAELLLASGADVNATGKNGNTPMHSAVARGNKEFVEALAKRGAKLDAFSMAALGRADDLRAYLKDQPIPKPPHPGLKSLMHVAAQFGQNESIAALLERDIDIDSKTRDGYTPLHLAAEHGQKATVEFLLKKGADLNAETTKDTFGPRSQTPLQLALAAGQAEVVRLLVAKGARPKLEGETVRQWWANAGYFKHLAILRYFIEQGLVTKADDLTAALLVAAEEDDLDLAKLLVTKGASVKSAQGAAQTPLVSAVRGNRQAMVVFLLEKGADANERQALRNAVFAGHKDIVELLIDKGASLKQLGDLDGIEPLHSAVLADRFDMVKLLLEKGADPTKDETLLHHAALRGRPQIVAALLAAGMDVNATSISGFYLYDWHFHKHPEVLDFFKERDLKKLRGVPGIGIPADPDEDWGHVMTGTPLHAAVAGKNKDAAELLLAKGAKVDAPLPGGETALHLAAYLGDVETAKLLLANKADLNAKNLAGVTALQLAEREGRKEMAAFLRKEGAK